MNRSMIFFVAIVSLFAGWGNALIQNDTIGVNAAPGIMNSLFSREKTPVTKKVTQRKKYKVQPSIPEPAKIQNDSIDVASPTVIDSEDAAAALTEDTVDTPKATWTPGNETKNYAAERVTGLNVDRGEADNHLRVTKIEEMVKTSILADNQRLDWLSQNEDKINSFLEKLRQKKNKLRVRMHKLKRIANVFENSKTEDQLRETASLPSSGSILDRFTTSYDAFISEFGYENADIRPLKNGVELNINMDNLVIRDNRRIRVSQDLSTSFVELIEKFKGKSNRINEVTLRTSRDASQKSILILKKYLSKQFGWKVRVKRTSNADSRYPVSLKLFSKMKVSNSNTKNDTEL